MGTKSSEKNGKRLVQSRLKIDSLKRLVKCAKCDMTYSPSVIDDTIIHKEYHEMHLKGRKWPCTWGLRVSSSAVDDLRPFTPPSSSGGSCSSNAKNERIVMVRSDHQIEVRTTIRILDIVNDELHAPHNENGFWCRPEGNGKAFLYIKEDRAVGVITIELLEPARCRWMIYDNRSIVNGVEPKFCLGISRIWVCRTQRNKGIATKLLEAARRNTIYGRTIEKWAMAWSQPTDSGGRLASHYNGVRHKSGKLLIPCYI